MGLLSPVDMKRLLGRQTKPLGLNTSDAKQGGR